MSVPTLPAVSSRPPGGDHFMGLRQASWPRRAAMAAWQLAVAVAVGLGIVYLNPVSP